MSHAGGCLCKTVRFTVTAEPMASRVCWCRLCQYLGAGSGTVNLAFPSNALAVTGDVRWHGAVADSGNSLQRGFCPSCGAALFSKADSRPHLIFIRAGAMDDPNLLAPQVTIWAKEAPTWACIDPYLPQFDGQPPPVG